ncbi:uncharacterized protein LOC125947781 [Dermacentor silvarum]|uniref:uncharacterized protein LOC125947781 n=1 Tax=Dermacentor silvarum TaxID=543639 RepID=UPI0021018534|nr:uncharacterized protein LOC125947781 [Dermacentor silvarum]
MTSKQAAPVDEDASSGSPQFGSMNGGTGAALRQSALASPSLEQVLEQLQHEQKRDGRRVLVGFIVMTLAIGFVVMVVLARILLDDAPAGRMPPARSGRSEANHGRRAVIENDSDFETVGEADARFIGALLGGNRTYLR